MSRGRFQGPRAIAGGRLGENVDARVLAVLDVLAGERTSEVAERHGVDGALLHRWVRAFVEAGAAQVTNRPPPDIARQRDRFLSVFTHGLRSPLTVARAWAGLLDDPETEGLSRQQAVARLRSALDLLEERIGEVEMLTAAMLGRVEPKVERCTVAELAAALTPPEQIGGDGADLSVVVDPDLFARVLRDLWRAATLTPPAPVRVWVEARRLESCTELRVVRAGRPVDIGAARALFEPFDSVDGSSTGVTVGLYLARALTVVHGGTLGMEQDKAHGVFWVRLPHPDLPSIGPRPTGATTDDQGGP